jgi:predicted amidophosphoribosyltransferase
MLSTKAVRVICPGCEKETKVLGRVDMCMHCREPLTLDKGLEGKEFDESYNKKKMSK